MPTADEIHKILVKELSAVHVAVQDNSAQHAGHAGAKQGGHFSVLIIAKNFENKSLVERHRMVYTALQEKMQQGIHALAIQAFTPEEFQKQK
ncbi:MAG: hypothetical protein A3D10_03690 [Omnitrophica WOR_2 bacterium RIFCSPHIGHO2_02_FULL_48_11]|nr:MAG: hypothetical protein A3D10_03690 [Omnitrophica WOR_2 bacterium RIFCSPHIGHO2_02_FULL_48_11]